MPENMGFPSPPPIKDPTLLQKILAGLTGTPANANAVDPAIQQAARQQALMAMSAQLLAGSGPSPQRQSFGSVLGPALLAGQQANQQSIDSALQTQLLMSQIQRNKQKQEQRKLTTVGAGGAVLDENGNVVFRNPAKESAGPSNWEEWVRYNELSPDDQKRYLEMKRNQNALQLVDIAGGKSVFNKASGAIAPVTTVGQEAEAASRIAGATTVAKVTGESQATAQIDLPRVEDNAKQMLGLLDRIEKHPGRQIATGGTSALQLQRIPGTSARDFNALLDQVRGKQFLEAFNSLKGGGQITEVEGKKAETAISTIQDTGQSEAAYLQAVKDLRQVVSAGVERARKKANMAAPTSAPKRIRVDAEGNIVGN